MAIPDPVLSLRIDRSYLDELRTAASRRGLKPSVYARRLLEARLRRMLKPSATAVASAG